MGPRLLVNTDAAGPVRGKAGAGIFISDKGTQQPLLEVGLALGDTMDTFAAEYRALILGIRLARAFRADFVLFLLDAQSVAYQMRGTYGVQSPHAARLYLQAHRDLQSWPVAFQFDYVPRGLNTEADRLSRVGLYQSFHWLQHPACPRSAALATIATSLRQLYHHYEGVPPHAKNTPRLGNRR